MDMPEPDPGAPRRPRRWQHAWTPVHTVVAVALAVGGVLATLDAWVDISRFALAPDQESSQVFLAPVVAAWLFWVRRGRLRGYAPGSLWVGPVLVAVGWILHRYGDLRLYQSLWHFGALLVVMGCFLSVAGGGFLYRVLPAFGALCFVVPVPGVLRQQIALPLQEVTAQVTEHALDLLGVAGIDRSGNSIRINGQNVMVAEACNGLRMVFSLVMVSFAFAYGTPLRNGIRFFIIVASPLTAILFNVLRLIPVVWAYGSLSPEIGASIHDISGWAMLPCAFVALMGGMRLLRWAQVPVSPYLLAYGN